MYKTILINTIEEARGILFDQEYQPAIGRNRSLYVYRGIPNVNYTLQTSLQRNCKSKMGVLEINILNNFAKYAELEDPTINTSIWRKMILGQHHGLPTRLLDWSRSPLMSLHFATSGEGLDDMDKHDCVLWRIDVSKLNNRLPEKYKDMIKKHQQQVFTVDMLEELQLDLAEYDLDMQDDTMIMMEPPTIDMRIANQYSFFSIVPKHVDKLEDVLEKYDEDVVTKYVISKNLRWEIRDMLDQANINERIVYPGLDGIATWLKRYYFVRNVTRLQIKTMGVASLDADMIVCPNDPTLAGYGSVAKSIYHDAGPQLVEECKTIPTCDFGDVVVTKGYNLKAKNIYHTIIPRYEGNKYELVLIYNKLFELALQNNCHSIGLPLLGAGNTGYDIEDCWELCILACEGFIEENDGIPLDITICVLDDATRVQGESIRKWIDNDEEEVSNRYKDLLGASRRNRR